jgi:hypothetical protein
MQANGVTSPLKEVMLWIFIALRNPLLSGGFEHMNLESNGKHDNRYTTDNDINILSHVQYVL